VLAFADPGKTQPVRVDLNGVLRDAVSFLRSNPAFRRTEVSFVPAGDGLFVLGNPVTLGQLFLNLLINALQFQPAGGLIEVVAGAGERTAIVSVTDHGPGIRPEDLPRIFEPFFSTRGSTGLGLSVCQAIALAHGGNITAENREEGGACFRVEIPLDAPGVPVADEAQAPAGRRGIAAAGAPMPERGLPVESLSFPEER
jgi:signal transduction histidine kinase